MGCALCDDHRSRGHKFCAECGTRLAEAAPGNPVERRQITVLFYDLVGSTRLSTACDPEDFREAIQRFHAEVTVAVQPYQGFVGAHVGDGGIVYFGYPVARENAAECAVLAGLALARAVEKLVLPDGRRAQARIGIATGTGVVGRIEDGDTGNSAVGAVTSLAARLQGQCNPGQTVISGTTRKLIGELFDLEDLGFLEAKGISGGARAFRVMGRSRLDRFEALHGASARLVGREAERALLEEAWEDALAASDGPAGIAVVAADAGIGKSRFCLEFARAKVAEGAQRITVFCTPHGQNSALHPFVTHLRRRAARLGQASDTTLAPAAAPPLDEAILPRILAEGTGAGDTALLARMLGLPVELPHDLATLTPTELLDRTIDAVIEQLRLSAQDAPLVVLFEDVHWADPTSLLLLRKIVDGALSGRILMLLTLRPSESPAGLDLSQARHIALEPFAPEAVRTLIEQLLGARAAPSLVDAISERAGGVPLFVEELTRALMDRQGFARPDDAAPQDDREGDPVELSAGVALPETLQDSLLARLDALGPVKRVAQVASVIGRLFSLDALEGVLAAADPAAGRDLADACARLETAGLVQQSGEASAGQYLFRHVLIQEFAYSTLVRADRRKLNAVLLDRLEHGGPAGTVDPERLAHHAMEAGRTAQAIGYWTRAGLAALAQSTMPEAEARLRAGLELVPQIANARERAQLELELQLALGKVLLARYGHASEDIGRTFDRARVLAEEVGDRRQILAALHGLQAHDLQHSRMVSARNRSAEMLALARAEGDDVWAVIGRRSRGIASFPLGEYRQSAKDLGEGLALLDRVDLSAVRRVVVDDIQAAMQIYRSWSLIFLGEAEEGRELARFAHERAQNLAQPYTLAFASIGDLYTRLLLGDLDGLEEDFARLFAICDKYDIWYFGATGRIFRGLYEVLTGDGNAAATIRSGLEDYRQTGSILYQPTYTHWLALAHLASGDDAAASEANRWTIDTSLEHDMHHQTGEFYGLAAVLHHRANDSEARDRSMQTAYEITARQGAVHCTRLNEALWEEHGLLELARQAG